MKKLTLTIVFLASVSSAAEKFPLERYDEVIRRQMFGELPPGFDPSAPPNTVSARSAKKELSKEQEQLMKAVHFSAINVTAEGEVEVGFSDMSVPTNPKHYFLRPGQSSGGWKVESADADSASVVLIKDGILLELTLGDKSAQAAGKVAQQDSAAGKSKEGPALTGRERRSRKLAQERSFLRKELEELKNTLLKAKKDAVSGGASPGEGDDSQDRSREKPATAAEGAQNEKDAIE